MRWLCAFLLGSAVAACGADGEPVTPTRDATITLSDAGGSGVARVGLNRGSVTVSVGLGL